MYVIHNAWMDGWIDGFRGRSRSLGHTLAHNLLPSSVVCTGSRGLLSLVDVGSPS